MALVQRVTVVEAWSFDAKPIPKELTDELSNKNNDEQAPEMVILEFIDMGSESKDKYRFPLQLSNVDGLIGELQKLKKSKLHVAGADDMPPPPLSGAEA